MTRLKKKDPHRVARHRVPVPAHRPGSDQLVPAQKPVLVAQAGSGDLPAPAQKPGEQGNGGQGDDGVVRPALKPRMVAAREGWSVQVGAFRHYDSARRYILSAADRLPDRLAHSGIAIEPMGTGRRARKIFRARLIGFKRAEVKQVCRVLKSHNMGCVPLPPGTVVASDLRS